METTSDYLIFNYYKETDPSKLLIYDTMEIMISDINIKGPGSYDDHKMHILFPMDIMDLIIIRYYKIEWIYWMIYIIFFIDKVV